MFSRAISASSCGARARVAATISMSTSAVGMARRRLTTMPACVGGASTLLTATATANATARRFSTTSTTPTSSPPTQLHPTVSYGYRTGPLTRTEIDDFHRDGYIIKRQFYNADEMNLLLRIARADREMDQGSIAVPDASGKISKLSVWNDVSDDFYSMFSRGDRMVTAMEQLLGDEVYHYHSKMMLKEPRVGGAWEWHQDYGYWYQNGVLYPRMASGLIAVDRANKANGCLQVLKGSHHLGRIEHGVTGGQTGADGRVVDECLKRLERVYIECEPGDVLLFHCNTLHASSSNDSPNPRWSLICCYNAKSNNPFRKSHHPSYTPLVKVPDSAILEWPARNNNATTSRPAFLNPEDDHSTPGSRRMHA